MNLSGEIGDDAEADLTAMLGRVGSYPVSEPIDHDADCCTTARRWLCAMHAAAASTMQLSGLGWIAEMYPWGPSQWPMSWCSLVEQERLDCGGHSAIAREAIGFGGGVVTVQLLIRAGPSDLTHWGHAWRNAGVAPTWLFEDFYYHEAIGVADKGLVVFDPTRNCRISPEGRGEPGSVAAIRVNGGAVPSLRWGPHAVALGRWVIIRRHAA